jgi:hypothetical protein
LFFVRQVAVNGDHFVPLVTALERFQTRTHLHDLSHTRYKDQDGGSVLTDFSN